MQRHSLGRYAAILSLRVMSWLGQHEPVTLISLLLVAAGLWGFAELADEVIEGETGWFDEAILLSMRESADRNDPWGPRWFEELVRDFTALGSVGVLTFVTAAVIGFLVLQSKTRVAWFVFAAVAGGVLVSHGLKIVYARPRPELVPHRSYVVTSSFPSGHSMLATAAYLTLGALLTRTQTRRRIKAYLLLLALFLSITVGVSRVYLGVHWPTDVLAGWTIGACWALAMWMIALHLQRRGQVESPTNSP